MAEQEPVYLIVAENATTCRKILARGGCDRCALRHCAPPWALYDATPATLRGRCSRRSTSRRTRAAPSASAPWRDDGPGRRARRRRTGLGAARGWPPRRGAAVLGRPRRRGRRRNALGRDALRRVVAADLDSGAPEQHGSGTTGALLLRPDLRRRAGRRRRSAGAAPAKAAETEGPRRGGAEKTPSPCRRRASPPRSRLWMPTSARRSRRTSRHLQIRVSVKCCASRLPGLPLPQLGRRTPQSSWVVDGRVKGVGSVGSVFVLRRRPWPTVRVIRRVGPRDWDVRMLGTGGKPTPSCRSAGGSRRCGGRFRARGSRASAGWWGIQVEIADKARPTPSTLQLKRR